MGNNTTRTLGKATDSPCIKKATALLFHNYQTLKENLCEALQPYAYDGDEVDKLWDEAEVWDGDAGRNTNVAGFYASLYTPKDGNGCPPVLVFRGTKLEDIRGFAVSGEIGVRLKSMPASVLFGYVPKAYSHRFLVPVGAKLQGLMGENAEVSKPALAQLVTKEGWSKLYQTGKQESFKRGFATLPFELDPFVDFTLWGKEEGDWAANLLQGTGKISKQYIEVKKIIKKVAPMIQADWDNRLIITGHSLGGGLASVAGLYCKEYFPEINDLTCPTYDAAGVHNATLRELRVSKENSAAARVLGHSVADEVLTSLQSDADLLPLISSFIRYTGIAVPKAVGELSPTQGVSPGFLGGAKGEAKKKEGNPHAKPLAAAGDKIPDLLPIENQNLIKGKSALAHFTNLSGLASSASGFKEFLGNLDQELEGRVREAREERQRSEQKEVNDELADELADENARQARDIGQEMSRQSRDAQRAAQEQAREASQAAERQARAAAEQAEKAESDAKEVAAEANEPGGFWGGVYNVLIDEPSDMLGSAADGISDAAQSTTNAALDMSQNVVDGMADVATDVGHAVSDGVTDALDMVGDNIVNAGDEIKDALNQGVDAVGDVGHAAYELVQYGHEALKYFNGLKAENGDFLKLVGTVAQYHTSELVGTTFVVK